MKTKKPVLHLFEKNGGKVTFAALAKKILSADAGKSNAIALNATWNADKSPLLNELNKKTQQERGKGIKKAAVSRFSPWLCQNIDTLAPEFLTELIKPLNNRLLKKYWIPNFLMKLFTALAFLFFILAALRLIFLKLLEAVAVFPEPPEKISIILSILTLSILILQSVPNGWAWFRNVIAERLGYPILIELTNGKDILNKKKTINEELADFSRRQRIVLFIDDIDDISGEALRELFRTIRLNKDLPSITYIVVFDRPLAEKRLDKLGGIGGRDYLDEIIDTSFDLKPAKR